MGKKDHILPDKKTVELILEKLHPEKKLDPNTPVIEIDDSIDSSAGTIRDASIDKSNMKGKRRIRNKKSKKELIFENQKRIKTDEEENNIFYIQKTWFEFESALNHEVDYH